MSTRCLREFVVAPHEIFLTIILVLVVAGTAGYLLVQSIAAANRTSGYKAAFDWSRMNPPPPSARAMTLEVDGSMFTREFTVTFTASIADIDAWLAASPGTARVMPTRQGAIRTYAVQPGGGAVFAEAIVDEQTGQVTIRTSWS